MKGYKRIKLQLLIRFERVMEGSSQSSLSEEDSSSKERSLPEEENELQSECVSLHRLLLSLSGRKQQLCVCV